MKKSSSPAKAGAGGKRAAEKMAAYRLRPVLSFLSMYME